MMKKIKVLEGDYIKISTKGRFKSRSSDKKQKARSKTVLSSGNIYPFSSTVLTDFAF
jgi:hypothetical protein